MGREKSSTMTKSQYLAETHHNHCAKTKALYYGNLCRTHAYLYKGRQAFLTEPLRLMQLGSVSALNGLQQANTMSH